MRGKVIYGQKRNYYFLDGKAVSQKEFDRAFHSKTAELLADGSPPDGARSACWPMKGSDALSVIPQRIAKASAADKKNGVPTEYTSEGQPIFRDRAHRREYLRAYGFHDRDGGYGD